MDINRNNYETFFLLYLDGELSQAGKTLVEKFLSENADLQKEFSVLKSVRLMPDEIYFDEKHSLLRREEKRRVLPMYWLRMTAVLMVGIAGTWFGANNLKISKIEKLKIEENEKIEKIEKIGKIEENGKMGKLKIGKIEKLKNKRNEKIEKEKIDAVESTEEIVDIQKSAINMKPETAEIDRVMDTRQIPAPEMKMTSLLATSTIPLNHNSNTVSSVSEPTDQSEDVSISVLSLSAKKKPVAGFFKKLMNNSNSEKSGRTVNVSVLQISY